MRDGQVVVAAAGTALGPLFASPRLLVHPKSLFGATRGGQSLDTEVREECDVSARRDQHLGGRDHLFLFATEHVHVHLSLVAAPVRGGAYVARATLECADGISGETVEIAGLETTMTDVLVRIYYADGQQETHLVQPNHPSAVIGGPSGTLERVVAYTRLGIQHIALGIDHLLFVLGLLLIVSSPMMLLKTVTSFTLAHSITLGIATLGFASVPELPLNAVIALSILFLGPEIVRVWRGETSLTIRNPWVVAFVFGLLHGFGFASGLTAMGLPQNEIPLALLFFNVGVELGQLAFVFLVLGLARSFRVLEIQWPRWVELAPGYAVGSLGALWFIERTVMMFGGRV